MPRADGSIPAVRVPALPWLEEYRTGDKVRTVRGLEGDLSDLPGSVVLVRENGPWRGVMVELDALEYRNRHGVGDRPDDLCFMFSPGELRRLS